jgi:AMP phosphorylase
MKLKIRNLNWYAGRPVVILHEDTAKKMNVFVDDRISILNPKRVYAVVDIFTGVVKKDEIGLSHEMSSVIKMKKGSLVEVGASEVSGATYLIKKKISGAHLTKEEISYLVSEIVHNNLTEAEIAYFTAAEKMNGMSFQETINLTKAMIKTGAHLTFKGKKVADKHCIGGIAGNRTTPIVVSICAAAGLTLPKTSSRAITSAAGTADVIETLTSVELPLEKIKKVVKETGACLAWGGSLGLAPSDDKIIRVERLLNLDIEPQLLASIMSKKISAGSKYLLIDIPYGFGAKVPNLEKAKALGSKFQKLAKYFKIKIKVVYTDGKQPVGNGFGPVLEMFDVVAVLRNLPNAPRDLREKSLQLSSELMSLCGIKNAREKAKEILNSGAAYKKFKQIILAQDGKMCFEEKVASLKLAKHKKKIKAPKSGEIVEISNKGMNSLCRVLGTPETIGAGVYLHKHLGPVRKGDRLMTLYSESRTKLKDGLKFIKEFKPIEIR